MTVSLVMMFGRLGAIIGNLLFPLLLKLGCLQTFGLIGGTAIGKYGIESLWHKISFYVFAVCSVICLLIPKTTKKPLQ
jgi:predicted membrane-bound spermidine synthase